MNSPAGSALYGEVVNRVFFTGLQNLNESLPSWKKQEDSVIGKNDTRRDGQ